MIQLDLLADQAPSPQSRPLDADGRRAAAEAFVRARRAALGCTRCGQQERLLFDHRQPRSWDVTVWALARSGATQRLLEDEMAKCQVFCRRCFLTSKQASNPEFRTSHKVWVTHAPQMLRARLRGPVRLVAKPETTTSGGESGPARAPAKARVSWKGLPYVA